VPIYTNLITDVGILFTFLFFWGCPALQAGRAVSGLAGLLGPSQKSCAFLLGLAPRATLAHPSAIKSWPSQPRPNKKKPQLNTQLRLLRQSTPLILHC